MLFGFFWAFILQKEISGWVDWDTYTAPLLALESLLIWKRQIVVEMIRWDVVHHIVESVAFKKYIMSVCIFQCMWHNVCCQSMVDATINQAVTNFVSSYPKSCFLHWETVVDDEYPFPHITVQWIVACNRRFQHECRWWGNGRECKKMIVPMPK